MTVNNRAVKTEPEENEVILIEKSKNYNGVSIKVLDSTEGVLFHFVS